MSTTTTALTTVFTPPSRCFSTVHIYTVGGGGNGGAYWLLGPEPTDQADCYPPNYQRATDFYYSPAFDCPVGYTTVASNTLVLGSETETRATCCPTSSYKYQSLTEGNSEYYSTIGCTITGPPNYYTTLPVVSQVSAGGAKLETTASRVGAGMNAYSIQIRWQSSDLGLFVQTSSPTSGLTATTTSTLIAASSSPSSPSPTSKTGGLSRGASAGIGVGVVLGVVALAAIMFVVYRLGRRHAHTGPVSHEAGMYYERSELADSGGSKLHNSGPEPQELDAKSAPLEML